MIEATNAPEKPITYPKEIQFTSSWRKYQQRILDHLDEHMANGHLHIIAPPGSGKTVLGLEVAIRLNKPTLILAPTIAIRNQWIQRFCELFLRVNTVPEWISNDIRKPAFMTVVTYQGLHAACNNLQEYESETDEEEQHILQTIKSANPNLDNIVKGLKLQRINTIVVDEAHHLKNEWWQTLTRVKEKLNPVIVGLTATPPYDVSPNEWQRYIEFNGSVDAEISVPELVIEGDLCPHQDYIHFTFPTAAENEKIKAFRAQIEALFLDLKTDETLINAIENHPVWINPAEHLEWIYTNLSCYSACLIFLHANNREIHQLHIEVIGDQKLKIPELDYHWMETLLNFYLYQEKVHFKLFEEHAKQLENKLKRCGAMEKRQINFSNNKVVSQSLTSSLSKLNGINTIVDFEFKQLGHGLRMVILSDYIRKEFYSNTPENKLELTKIGVIPIFEQLRRQNTIHKKIGVLTGSMVIIPASARRAFEDKARERRIAQISCTLVPFDTDYLIIYQNEQIKNDLIYIITEIFQQGEIEILIGTKSLLGEGWDAPAINALILASFVGSFVSSNQMRGRAIRTQQGNTGKTGNIWHLATIDATSPTGGDDFGLLKRRFKSFVGISFKSEPGIENGINRLNLPEDIIQETEASKKNSEMFAFAADRENLKQRWQTALEEGISLVEEIKIPFREERPYQEVKAMYLNKTIAHLFATLGSGLLGFGFESLEILARSSRHIKSPDQFYFILGIIGTLGLLIFGRLTLKTLRLYLKYRDISKDIQHIGEALLAGLIKTGVIQTDISQVYVQSAVDEHGAVFCHLEGASTFEKSTFINALQEIIAPIDNPRYVIIRKNRFMLFTKQKDYHAVPELIARNKNLAEYFKQQWENYVGSCDLIYTRTLEGRKLLLKSRIKSLSAQFQNKVEHVNKWR
ncbi:DEAD/DEAH box helicase family protein [Pedobacter soli]|uniref:Type III restriction enzyme, res subunit n=1 Tax=Pedobacter soli TaxID=390242 RepID=A0A1G6MIV8_9SPHI|nr:DEAD/DEAH box helicase family protein [Pedobacter soli]SDC54926.1 Type III restriction enzyme, res subunit [Pedobacter soli]